MTTSSRPRRIATALVAGASLAGLLVGTAGPSAASKAANKTTYKGTWVFDDGSTVTGSLKRDVQLTDYKSTEWYDRAAATPGRGDIAVAIGDKQCKPGSYFTSGLNVYAEPTNWLQTVDPETGETAPARVRIGCTSSDGVVHHVRWGRYVEEPGGTQPTSVDCVVLSRPAVDKIRITANADCVAQDEVVDSQGNTLSATSSSIPFSATLTFPL